MRVGNDGKSIEATKMELLKLETINFKPIRVGDRIVAIVEEKKNGGYENDRAGKDKDQEMGR